MRAVLTYHSIDPSGSAVSVDRGAFRRHVAFLASGRVRVLPLAEILREAAASALSSPSPSPSPSAQGDGADAVALTFDDGFVSFETEALPALRDAGLPATVYVVSDRVGADNRWGGARSEGIPDLALMDWDGIGRAAEAGIEIGSHTRTHPKLTEVSDARLEDELAGSRDRIAARTGAEPRSFAYPYGEVDDRAAAAAGRVYANAVTTQLAPLASASDLLRVPRLDAYYLREPGRLERFGTPGFRSYVARRALLRGLRRGVGRAFRGAPGAKDRGGAVPSAGYDR